MPTQNGFQVADPDQVTVVTQYAVLIDSAAGTASGTAQKIDNNSTDDASTPESGPVDLALTADEQATLLSDVATSLQAILAARAQASSEAAAPETDAEAAPAQS